MPNSEVACYELVVSGGCYGELAARKFQLMAWYLLTAELAGHVVQQLK